MTDCLGEIPIAVRSGPGEQLVEVTLDRIPRLQTQRPVLRHSYSRPRRSPLAWRTGGSDSDGNGNGLAGATSASFD